jgi:hypothetical protein
VRLIVATRSIIKEMPGSVAMGHPVSFFESFCEMFRQVASVCNLNVF